MEQWDIYDIDHNKTGTISSDAVIKPGDYHLVVNVCVFNSQDQLLIQKRQIDKDKWPDLWDVSVGGRAIKGETSRRAAERELQEELSLELDLSGVLPHLCVSFDRGFNDFYLVEEDVDLSQLQRQPEEVQRIKWASRDEVLELIGSQNFVPYHPEFIHLIFAMRHAYGVIRT